MKFLFMSEIGEGLPLAMKVAASQRDEVKFWIKKDVRVGVGMVDFVTDWYKEAKASEMVVFTSPNLYHYQELVDKWTPTVGGSRFEHNLNNDKALWRTLFKLGGGVLTNPKEGEVVSVGAWHGKGGWLLPAIVGRVESGLFEGGKGLEVDGVGVSVTSDYNRKLFHSLLEPFSQTLKQKRFVGFVSMEASYDGKDVFPLGFQAGLDSFLIPPTTEISKCPFPNLLIRLQAKSLRSSEVKPHYGVSINISIPPYPYTDMPIPTIELPNIDHITSDHLWLLDVNKINGNVRCAGHSGALGFASGGSVSLRDARRRALKVIKTLEIPRLQYRKDIGNGFNRLVDNILQ